MSAVDAYAAGPAGANMNLEAQTGADESQLAPSEAEERLAAAVSSGVARLSQGRLVWANARLVEMAGRGRLAALVGMPVAELFADAGNGLPGPQRVVECRLRRPDGAGRRVVCRPAGRGEAGDGLLVVDDVTHERSLESELLVTSQALQKANAEAATLRERLRSEHGEREEFLTVVSHELRTPVTVIAGYNRLLLSGQVGPLTEEQERFLEESAVACQRLQTFIDSLLEVARVTSGDEVLEVGRGALSSRIESVLRLLQPLLDEGGVRVELDIAPEAAYARFDEARVERVLANLVGNAVKFGPPKGLIRIATRLRPHVPTPGGPPRDFVEVSVSDAGPGIAARDRERIFQPYARATCRADGLGLGLAICKRLVEAHGGGIWVEDAPGGGSRFAFTLPASESPVGEG